MSNSLDEQLFEAMYPGLLDGEPLDMQQLMRKRRQPRIEAIKKVFQDAGYTNAAALLEASRLLVKQAEILSDMVTTPQPPVRVQFESGIES